MRTSPPIWALLVLLAGLCVTQFLRLTDRGMPHADAITAILAVVAAACGLPLLILVLLGSRNRKLVAQLSRNEGASHRLFPIYFSRELGDALRSFSPAMGREFDKHAVMLLSEAGITIWAAQKHKPVTPELVATIPRDDILAVLEDTIPIHGGGFWGLRIEVLTPEGDHASALPIGLPNRRVAAYFPSRREVARSHEQILALISPAGAHA